MFPSLQGGQVSLQAPLVPSSQVKMSDLAVQPMGISAPLSISHGVRMFPDQQRGQLLSAPLTQKKKKT